jgi:ubiquinone biosynthesis protein Coq4
MRNPLSLVKIARAGITLVRDPDRLGEVFEIADGLADTGSIDAIIDHVRRDPGGASALVEHPRVQLDLPTLRTLPDGSFGREAARFLDARGLDPGNLPHRPASDARSFVRAHLYETHDLWHVATGFDTDVAGEVGLQAFYLAQFPARLAAILLGLMFMNTFLYRFDDRDRRMEAMVRGWQLGRAARPLFGVRWDTLWTTPLEEVRARHGLC